MSVAENLVLRGDMEKKCFEAADLLRRFDLLPKTIRCKHSRTRLMPNRPLEGYETPNGEILLLEGALIFCPDCHRWAGVVPRWPHNGHRSATVNQALFALEGEQNPRAVSASFQGEGK
jgi:hypothetical protein